VRGYRDQLPVVFSRCGQQINVVPFAVVLIEQDLSVLPSHGAAAPLLLNNIRAAATYVQGTNASSTASIAVSAGLTASTYD
jgi:hypothetical protein